MLLPLEQIQKIATQANLEPDICPIINSESPVFLKKLELIQYWYEEESAQLEQDMPANVQIQRNVELDERCGSRFIKLQLDGIFFEVDTPDAIAVVLRLRSKLPKGYMPIMLDFQRRQELLKEDFEEALQNAKKRSLIGVVKLDDHYQIVQFFGTAGGNYDLSNSEIIDKLRDWEKLCEFEIIGGGEDTLDLAFRTLPKDRLAFVEDIYNFCPDLLSQGYVGPPLGEGATLEDYAEAMDKQTVEDLADYVERNMAVGFWWD